MITAWIWGRKAIVAKKGGATVITIVHVVLFVVATEQDEPVRCPIFAKHNAHGVARIPWREWGGRLIRVWASVLHNGDSQPIAHFRIIGDRNTIVKAPYPVVIV